MIVIDLVADTSIAAVNIKNEAALAATALPFKHFLALLCGEMVSSVGSATVTARV